MVLFTCRRHLLLVFHSQVIRVSCLQMTSLLKVSFSLNFSLSWSADKMPERHRTRVRIILYTLFDRTPGPQRTGVVSTRAPAVGHLQASLPSQCPRTVRHLWGMWRSPAPSSGPGRSACSPVDATTAAEHWSTTAGSSLLNTATSGTTTTTTNNTTNTEGITKGITTTTIFTVLLLCCVIFALSHDSSFCLLSLQT